MQNDVNPVIPLNRAQRETVDRLRGILASVDPAPHEELLDAWEDLQATMTSSTQSGVRQELRTALTKLQFDGAEKLASLLARWGKENDDEQTRLLIRDFNRFGPDSPFVHIYAST